ncbi:MAG: hypothetical protein HY700_14475 [Gemmatimonadetes bacterium]|nr:hypothetical protein [Gemmatimonadota bacterium]
MPFRRPVLLLFVLAANLSAQEPRVGGRSEVFAGSEIEQYLRFLQSDGRVPLYPWTIGAFSPAEVGRLLPSDSMHPWAARYALSRQARPAIEIDLVRPAATLIQNTTFPYGSNDGPLWAGRGITAALQAGIAARAGPFSLTLAPMVFRAQNASFDLQSNGLTGRLAYADAQQPGNIDRPQRFGPDPYAVLDPGQSTARIDWKGVTLGGSTANQRWGPGLTYPIILGNNAAGFPHLFFGTSSPVDLWLFRLHGRVVWGTLAESDYSAATGVQTRRFMSGVVALVIPRGLPGLELGGGRFFHTPWPADGLTWRNFRKPFEAIFKKNLTGDPNLPDANQDTDNQLASVFFRWVLPASGAELYGEYAREDHNWDLRDFTVEPDHSAGYLLGLRKVWRHGADRFWGLRGEVVNLQPSTLIRGRGEDPFYVHFAARQGHTQRGQVLGADVGNGGAGATLGLDYYHPGGRWAIAWSRVLRQDIGEYWRNNVLNPRSLDVVHTLAVEGIFFRGIFDLTGQLAGSYEFNRNFVKDAFNLNAVLGVRMGFDLPKGER